MQIQPDLHVGRKYITWEVREEKLVVDENEWKYIFDSDKWCFKTKIYTGLFKKKLCAMNVSCILKSDGKYSSSKRHVVRFSCKHSKCNRIYNLESVTSANDKHEFRIKYFGIIKHNGQSNPTDVEFRNQETPKDNELAAQISEVVEQQELTCDHPNDPNQQIVEEQQLPVSTYNSDDLNDVSYVQFSNQDTTKDIELPTEHCEVAEQQELACDFAVVSTYNSDDPNNANYEVYAVFSSGELSAEPLDLPSNVVEKIRKSFGI